MTLDPLSSSALSPSEEALLNGADLVPKGGLLDKFKLLGSEIEVSKKQLACTVYAAAFLGAEEAGELRLELRSKKALLGLRTVQALYAEPTGPACPWPVETCESELYPLAQRLKASKGQNEVGQILYQYLREDSTSPFDTGLQHVYSGLAGRGLLTRVAVKKLAVFTVQHLELPEGTASLGRAATSHVADLLETCRRTRPDVWKALLAQIEAAFTRRRELQEMDGSE